MRRLLQNAAGDVSIQLRDSAGDVVAADSDTVTVVIVDSAGDALSSGTAVPSGTGATKLYSYPLSKTDTATLDRYTVTWTATVAGAESEFTTYYEVVGGFLFAINQVRAAEPTLENTTKYTSDRIREVREQVEDVFESACRTAFRPKGRRVRLDGNGDTTLTLPDLYPRSIYSATIDGVDVTLSEIVLYEAGFAKLDNGSSWTAGKGNVVLHYAYGLDAPPEPIVEAAIRYAVTRLVKSPVNERATSESTDVGTFRLATAGRDGQTGYPEIDAVLKLFGAGDHPVVS